MRNETKMDIAASHLRGETYDEACKNLLKNKEIIAPILQMLVPEYRDYTVEEVISFIDADSISVGTPVEDIPVEIKGENTEFSSLTEKLVRFDSLFRAINPKLSSQDIIVSLHIDIDVQNKYFPGNPSYPVIKRAIYYAAREIGRQLGRLTETTDYGRLEKVYSIWICNEGIPPALRGTVSQYDICRKDVIGTAEEEPDADYDLLSIIIVRREEQDSQKGIFDYLKGIFTSDLHRISQYVDADRNTALVQEVSHMVGLGASLIEQGIEQGMEKGLIQGREEGIKEGVKEVTELMAAYFMEQDPGLSKEKALEMVSEILRRKQTED